MAHNLAALQAQLRAVEAAISEVYTNGINYQITGSHSKTSASLRDLNAERARIVRAILRLSGYRSRVGVDFDGTTNEANTSNIDEA